jgi:acyl carrier protein
MVRRVLRTEFELEAAELAEDAHLVDDLELDSVDAVALAVRLEEETGIALEEEALRAVRTVGDVAGIVHERLAR